jgi:dolichol-phosphate hexosyltransferase
MNPNNKNKYEVMKDEVTIILPVLNEEEAILEVIDDLHLEGYKNILVVDGHSSDNTYDIVFKAGVRIIYQKGTGKTGALKTGFNEVDTPYILVMDGDFTYRAADIIKLLPYVDDADQIFGIRSHGRENISRLHRFGNLIINTTLNLLLNSNFSDVCTGMYLMKTDLAQSLELKSDGFNVEVEMAIQNYSKGNVKEIPIHYRPRLGESKLNTWVAGFNILSSVITTCLKYNSFNFYALLGIASIIPGLGLIIAELYAGNFEKEFIRFDVYLGLGLIFLFIGISSLTISILSLINKRSEQRLHK